MTAPVILLILVSIQAVLSLALAIQTWRNYQLLRNQLRKMEETHL